MSLFRSPEEHAANPPESWEVTKVMNKRWHLTTTAGTVLHSSERKRDCEELKTSGFYFNLYRKEARWYAGEEVSGWKPYAKSEKS